MERKDLEIVNTINKQLLSVGLFVYFSWGVQKRAAIYFEKKPTLALKVSGLYHKGLVLISYNEGADLYDVTLTDMKMKPQKRYNGIYNDELGHLVDTIIERGYTTEDEYKKLAFKDSEIKMAQ